MNSLPQDRDQLAEKIVHYYLIKQLEPFKGIYERIQGELLSEYGRNLMPLWEAISAGELFDFIKKNRSAWNPWEHERVYDPDELCSPELQKYLPDDPVLRIGLLAIKKFMRDDFLNNASGQELERVIEKYQEALKDARYRFLLFVVASKFLEGEIKSGSIPKDKVEAFITETDSDSSSPLAHIIAVKLLLAAPPGRLNKILDMIDYIVLEENNLLKHGLTEHEKELVKFILTEVEPFKKELRAFTKESAKMFPLDIPPNIDEQMDEGQWQSLKPLSRQERRHIGEAYVRGVKALRNYKEKIPGAHAIDLLKKYLMEEANQYFKSEKGFPKDSETRYLCPACGEDCTEIVIQEREKKQKREVGITCPQPQCGENFNERMARKILNAVYFPHLDRSEEEEDDDYPDFWDQYSDGNIIPRDIERVIDKVSLEKILKSAETLSDKQKKVIESDLKDPDSGDEEKAQKLKLPSAGAVRSLRTDAHKELKKVEEKK